MTSPPSPNVFIAYPSAPPGVGLAIEDAVEILRTERRITSVRSWAQNDIPGRFLDEPIHENIEAADYVAADISRLNFNVAYEIGYAIGKGKRVLLVHHSSLEFDRALVEEVGIFDTLGRQPYSDSRQLANLLIGMSDVRPIQISTKN